MSISDSHETSCKDENSHSSHQLPCSFPSGREAHGTMEELIPKLKWRTKSAVQGVGSGGTDLLLWGTWWVDC